MPVTQSEIGGIDFQFNCLMTESSKSITVQLISAFANWLFVDPPNSPRFAFQVVTGILTWIKVFSYLELRVKVSLVSSEKIWTRI